MLEKKYPKDFTKMLAQAKKYATTEKACELHGTSFEARAEKGLTKLERSLEGFVTI